MEQEFSFESEVTISGLDSGKIYRVALTALNSEGESDQSDYLLVAATTLPAAPLSITKHTDSTKDSIKLEWSAVP